MSWYINNKTFIDPDYVPESAWHKHAPFANWLLSILKPKSIVELGLHNGFSYFIFCQYAKNIKSKITCIGIDHWKGDEHAGFYDEGIFQTFLKHHKRYEKISTIIKSTFEEAVVSFREGSINLLHIDGRHYYDDVKQDFTIWKGKVSNDGVVLFHDINVHENNFGVHKLWSEIKNQYNLHFEFEHGHGLGVLCLGNGTTLPKNLLRLFTCSSGQEKIIQNLYHKLGNEIHYKYLLKAYTIPYFEG